MKLSKADALFLHSYLFHCLTVDHGDDVRSRLEEMLDSLSEFLLSEDPEEEEVEEDDPEDDLVEVEEVEDSEDDAEDEEEVEDLTADEHVSPSLLGELSSITVVSPAGDKVSLEFEDVGSSGSVDALIDDGSVIIDTVTHVTVTKDSKTIRLHSEGEWHDFSVRKLPKAWKESLKPGLLFAVEASEDEEEEG